MENFNHLNTVYKNYFSVLANTGYMNYKHVERLLVYDCIVNILEGDMGIYVTEEDYKAMQQALYCLYGSTCLIPYPRFINEDNMGYNEYDFIPRITETGILRNTETGDIRIAEIY